jgi:hypothetical protein
VGGAKIAALVSAALRFRHYVVDLERVSFVAGFMAEPATVLLHEHLLAGCAVGGVIPLPACGPAAVTTPLFLLLAAWTALSLVVAVRGTPAFSHGVPLPVAGGAPVLGRKRGEP